MTEYYERTGSSNITGSVGEKVAMQYLVSELGCEIIKQSYRKPYGEIDIVARGTDGTVHFVEVKAQEHEDRAQLERFVQQREYNPEEHVDDNKLQRIARAVTAWLGEHPGTDRWQIDVLAVRFVAREKFASVNYLPNVGAG
jgi:Holliday junction resolvase-like predicted endonuclease